MARTFQFKLATVLRMRRLALQERQRTVAQRLAAIRDFQQRIDSLRRGIDEQTSAARSALSAPALAVEQILWDRRQLARLHRELAEAGTALQEQRAALVPQRRALAEAHVRVRSLERLEERQREAHQLQEQRQERRDEDERTAVRFGWSAAHQDEPA